nr:MULTISPECIES: carboxylating nicotinate-nucleotide diphosphorylase [Protofrankia]
MPLPSPPSPLSPPSPSPLSPPSPSPLSPPSPSLSPLSQETRSALVSAGLDPDALVMLIRGAVAEDLPALPADPVAPLDATADAAVRTVSSYDPDSVDTTSVATVPPDLAGRGAVVARARGVVAGLPVAAAVFEVVLTDRYPARHEPTGVRPTRDPSDVHRGDAAADEHADAESGWTGGLDIEIVASDGDQVSPGDAVLTVAGPVRALLTAERTALNLLCHLSGVATATRRWVDAVDGTGAAIRDTRKTLPGLRALEKYAVRCGGGRNHRMSLADAALVKDNHVVAAGGVAAAFAAVRARFPGLPVEVECDTVAQVAEAVTAGADLILCDNMSLDELRESVAIARPNGVELEASGGLTLDMARRVAETGVDYLAIGALTHSAPALDLGLDLDLSPRRGPGPAPASDVAPEAGAGSGTP